MCFNVHSFTCVLIRSHFVSSICTSIHCDYVEFFSCWIQCRSTTFVFIWKGCVLNICICMHLLCIWCKLHARSVALFMHLTDQLHVLTFEYIDTTVHFIAFKDELHSYLSLCCTLWCERVKILMPKVHLAQYALYSPPLWPSHARKRPERGGARTYGEKNNRDAR